VAPVAALRAPVDDDFETALALVEKRGVDRDLLRLIWNTGRSWIADDDGRVVGYARLSGTNDLIHAALDSATANDLLAAAEDDARQRGSDCIFVAVLPTDRALRSLAERHGFRPEREILRMKRILDGDLPAPAWPEGITVRTYTDADGEGVHALLDDEYSDWDSHYVRESHDHWLAFMTNPADFDPQLWFLAERDGELAGCALQWREHDRRGWVKDLVVRRGERGRGLGVALLRHVLREYATLGATEVGLKVDSNNPTGAVTLYEKVGFVVDQRQEVWLKRL
jgi:mycothiol synthase